MGLDPDVLALLRRGTVIPAHPLALRPDRTLDVPRQRDLTRYYLAAGAGGVAVGVHTTQFAIHRPEVDLYEEVLRLAATTIDEAALARPLVRVAGICGPTDHALREARIAERHGYHLGLLGMGGMEDHSERDLLDRARAVAEVLPVFGFYLQPSVGGRPLGFDFWRAFADIPGVEAIKIAPFDRYATLDVVRAVCESDRRDEIALYTGNDDNLVVDLLTEFRVPVGDEIVTKRIVGGLLGQWAVWTSRAVELFDRIAAARESGRLDPELLQLAVAWTDANGAVFDAANGFRGCIPGIHEVLRRQGLLRDLTVLDPNETLSPGQAAEIDRVIRSYPHLTDDGFVRSFLARRQAASLTAAGGGGEAAS